MTRAALAVLLAFPAAAAELEFAGKPAEVTVYTSGSARVTRTGELALPAGRTVARTEPLPHAADPGSVQVAFTGGAGKVSIESVETRRILVDDEPARERRTAHENALRAQQDKVYAAETELERLAEAIQSRQETIQFLAQIRAQAAKSAQRELEQQKMAVEAWGQALTLTEERADKARDDIRRFEGQQRLAQRALQEEQRKLWELQNKAPESVYRTRLFVTLRAAEAARGELRVAYNVGGARWEPSYRARADLGAKTAALEIFGTIRQNTGEDWNDAALRLSSARPDIGTDAPELRTWYIRSAGDAEPVGMKAASGEAMDMLRAAAGAPVPRPEAPAEPPSGAVSEGVATVFQAKHPATIPSDDQPHKIQVEQVSSPIEAEHLCVPKVLPFAFLRAKTANKAAFPLLPGEIDMLVGTSFVGRGRMKLTAPGEEIALSLGVDESVKVERHLLSDKVRRKVSRADRVATTNVFAIKATNFNAHPVMLTVMDQLPVSRSEEVVVSYGGEARRALRGAEFPGQLKWVLELGPRETKTVEFDFTLEYPQELRSALEAANAPAMQMMDIGQASAVSW